MVNNIKENIEKEEIILLEKKDVKELTGWGTNVIDRLFAYDKGFPAIKIGKKYQIELTALKAYLQTRRDSTLCEN